MASLSELRKRYIRKPDSENLRLYLTAKAKLGLWDSRYCRYYGVSADVNAGCRKAITRAYAAHLVPTSTKRSGRGGSYHNQRNRKGEGQAVDFGLRRSLIGTQKGLDRMRTFQRKELWRATQGKINPIELIGPDNYRNILRGRRANLSEGSALETQHDNHVHEAYPG